MQRMAHPDGEVATARAAGRQDTLMTLSSWSTTSVEDVAAAGTGPKWFQLYVYKDRSATTLNSSDSNGDSCSIVPRPNFAVDEGVGTCVRLGVS